MLSSHRQYCIIAIYKLPIGNYIQNLSLSIELEEFMKKIETKNIVKVCLAIFVLYLCICYWPNAAKLLDTIFTALKPLWLGCIAAYLLNILMNFYETHLFPDTRNKFISKSRRGICLFLSIITLVALCCLVIGLIVPQLTSCLRLLAAEIPVALKYLISQLDQTGILPEDIAQKISSADLQSEISQILGTVFSGIGNILSVFTNVISSVVSGVTTAFLALIFAIYLLIGKDKLKAQTRRVLKRYIKEHHYTKMKYVLSVFDDSFHRFVVGQCTEAVILGVLCTVGMLILQLPYAPMIGAVTAFTSLIPMVGAFIGGAIGTFLIFMESPIQACVFLIFLIILQQFEGNLIYPRVVGSSIGLPGIWVLAAVTVGGGVFGILGMLIGVPTAAALYRLLRDDLQRYEHEKTEEEPEADCGEQE